jgi:acyl carrier protein
MVKTGGDFYMTDKEKLELLEKTLEAPEGSLNEEMYLDMVENWDSMAVISLIVMLDEKLGKRITVSQVKQFKTLGDILKIME